MRRVKPMYEKTNHDESGGHLVASLTIELLVLVYELKAERKDEFRHFYDTEIRAWLAQNYVAHANSWIVDDYLIVASSSPMRPWSAIPGLERYVKQLEPKPAHALPKYHLSAPASAGSYAAD
jgi:hypothetical protein